MLEVFRGCVNQWECDEMGHMNVRYYLTKAAEALAYFGASVGLPPSYLIEQAWALRPQQHHIRFLREAHAGAPLYAVAGVLAQTSDSVDVLIEMRHSNNDAVAATIRGTVICADTTSGEAQPWSPEVAARLAELHCELPAHAAGRSLQLTQANTQASLSQANAMNLVPIAQGAITQQGVDYQGFMNVDTPIGVVSDGIPNLVTKVGARPAGDSKIGGAALEYCIYYQSWPKAEDLYVVRSGLAGFSEKTVQYVHWILDALTGKPIATGTAVAVSLDLVARKVVPIPAERIPFMQQNIVANLRA